MLRFRRANHSRAPFGGSRAGPAGDIIKEVKCYSFYLKPGEKTRMKEELARKRSRKKARKEQ